MADEAQIRHLLRRTEYVARQARVDHLKTLLLEQAVDDILDVTADVSIPPEIDHKADNGWEQYVFATKWWFDRMAFDSPKPIQEKMTFFWHGHFTSEWQKVEDSKMMMDQNKLFRDNAFGDFAHLAQMMAIQPAMLKYLDNADNTKKSPNQNFARELMELYLLGVGNYTEIDVESSAKAWTGHSVTWPAGSYIYQDKNHDKTDKWFFGRLGNWTGHDIIAMILEIKGDIVARYIVNKLWAYFATPSGGPPAGLDGAISAFRSTWQIKPVIRAILLQPEFYALASTEGLVRTPVDWVVAVMARTGYRADRLNPQWYLEGMGQIPFNPPNVSGWRPNGAWINTSSMGARAAFAGNVVNRLRNDSAYDWDALIVGTWKNPLNADTAINNVANLFALDLSAQTRAAMAGYLAAERAAKDDPATEEEWEGRNMWWEATNLLQMALLAPEMHLA